MKQSLKKQPKLKRSHNIKPDFTGAQFPPPHDIKSGKSPGDPVVEVATPNRTNNRTEGTNKNGVKVKGRALPK